MVIKPYIILIFEISFNFYVSKNFPFDLFSYISNSNWDKNTNVIISPILVSKTLLFLSNASVGKTQKEIIQTLRFNSVLEGNTYINKITEFFNLNKFLKFSNAICSRISLKHNFISLAKKFDFEYKDIYDKDDLISWIGRNTEYKFKEIFNNEDPKSFDFILISSLLFNGNLLSKFNLCNDHSNIYFYDLIGKRRKIQMLESKGNFNYYEDEKLKVIEIPFEENSMSTLIFIPSSKYNLQTLIDELNDEYYDIILKKMEKKNIELYIPKLKIEYKTQLANFLKQIGIKKAFRIDAEFPSITLNYGLHLTDFFHQASLEIKESFFQFATFIGLIDLNNKDYIQYKRINVNKPFLLFIKSNNFPKDFILMAKITKLGKK